MPSEHAHLQSASRVVLGLYILVIVFWTLFPFDFAWPYGGLFRHVGERFDGSVNFIDQTDWMENIAFFIPLGFLLALSIKRRVLGMGLVGGIVTAASAGLSLLVETGQTLLAFRDSTLSDIIANTLGGVAGFGLFALIAPRLMQPASTAVARLRTWATPGVLLGLAGGWIALNVVGLYWARDAATLADWFPGYPMVVGNETTGDRAWPGLVSEIHLADRALTAEEVSAVSSRKDASIPDVLGQSLVGSWKLLGPGPYPDASGHSPPLVWVGQPLLDDSDLPAFVSRDNWLRTPSALSYATRRMAETSSFTLVTTIENAQTHIPAIVRIITLSDGPLMRNFTLAHEAHEMVIRIRTPLTGPNGHNPELLIPGVFDMTRTRRVIITYDRSELRVFIDGVEHGKLKITPELATLFRLYPRSGWRLQIVSPVTTTHAGIYRAIVLVPLLAVLVPILMKRFWRRRALPGVLIGLAVVLSVLVEAMIVLIGDGHTAVLAFAFSLTFAGLTTAALWWLNRHKAPSYASRLAAVRIR